MRSFDNMLQENITINLQKQKEKKTAYMKVQNRGIFGRINRNAKAVSRSVNLLNKWNATLDNIAAKELGKPFESTQQLNSSNALCHSSKKSSNQDGS